MGIDYGTMDCVELTFFIQRIIFNRSLSIEDRGQGSIFYFANFLQRHITEYLTGKTDLPKDGDCVLMKNRGRLCHVGTLHIFQGKNFVVHTMDSFYYSCMHEMAKLNKYGFLEIEGIYSWK